MKDKEAIRIINQINATNKTGSILYQEIRIKIHLRPGQRLLSDAEIDELDDTLADIDAKSLFENFISDRLPEIGFRLIVSKD